MLFSVLPSSRVQPCRRPVLVIDEVDLAVKVHANIPAFGQGDPISQGVAGADPVAVGGFYEGGGRVVEGAGIKVVMHVVD